MLTSTACKMFPPRLHKNIRELDKQITLLESECENMETEKRKKCVNAVCFSKQREPGTYLKKAGVKENVERPFFTGPRFPDTLSTKKTSKQLAVPKLYPRSSVTTRKTVSNKDLSTTTSEEYSKSVKRSNCCPISGVIRERPQSGNRKEKFQGNCPCGKELVNDCSETVNSYEINNRCDECNSEKHILHKGVLHAHPGGTIEVTVTQTSQKVNNIAMKGCRRTVGTIKGSSMEKTDSESAVLRENPPLSAVKIQQRKNQKEQKWSEILGQESDSAVDSKIRSSRLKNNHIKSSYSLGSKPLDHSVPDPTHLNSVGDTHIRIPILKFNKCDKEIETDRWHNENENPDLPALTSPNKLLQKTPIRRKNMENVIDESLKTPISYKEKEVQCDGDEKSFASDRSFDPVIAFCNPIESLRGYFDEEEAKRLLSEVELSLNKLTEEPEMKRNKEKVQKYNAYNQEKEYIKKLQKHFLSSWKLCEKLSKEKNKLSEDLAVKEQLLSKLTIKEEEYLAVITNLKVSLEKKKAEAEDNVEIMKELNIVKNKLVNETKVADALRKSHAKMQEQIQKCTLENDKLKTEIRLNKLESQKFCVLLAGKNAEIKRYKEEVESFQRQITDQLAALRSNNAANEIQKAMTAIIQHSQVFSGSDLDSAFSETQTDEKNCQSSSRREKLMHSSPTSTKSSSLNSSWNQISSINEFEAKSHPTTEETGNEVFIGDLNRLGIRDEDDSDEKKPPSFVSCKSVEDLTGLEDVGNSAASDWKLGSVKSMDEDASSDRFRKNVKDLFKDHNSKCLKRILSMSAGLEDLLNTSDLSELSENFLEKEKPLRAT